MQKKYLVTPALPYANGSIHLGHLLEHVQVNVFVRALRMDGQDVLYVCGADSHGTPIEMNAMKAEMPPEQFANKWREQQADSLKSFGIEFDGGYGSTHTKENEIQARKIFAALKNAGYISTREIEQLYDPELKRFLPDRLVLGTCPKCHAKDQYGDVCEACGGSYSPTDLIEPRSALSGIKPIMKKSMHYFVSLKAFELKLKEWIYKDKTVHEDIRAYLDHWFAEGLNDWDISRDQPYFGFLIPGETTKYFYVWLDAPIAYITLSEQAAKQRNRSLADYWQDRNTKIIHFIGKDIIYFHTLFWPAMLMAADYTLPYQIVVHGILTVDGEKMSKSKGTFILADVFKRHINSESLRYYFACKLSNRSEDIDLNLADFVQRVNTDLVNKVVNLTSRTLPLLHRYFDGKASNLSPDAALLINRAKNVVLEVKELYYQNELSRAMNEIVRLAEETNRYLQNEAPWNMVKDNPTKAHEVLTTGLFLGKVTFGLLKPVLPEAVKILETIINDGIEYNFDTLGEAFIPGKRFKAYQHLFTRIEDESVTAMIEESRSVKKNTAMTIAEEKVMEDNTIDLDQFMGVDLRAAAVLDAKPVEGSDKLILCSLDVGELGKRQILTGLRPHIDADQLIGRVVMIVANLAPRKMRFGVSEGMILACGDKEPMPIFLTGAKPGDRVR